MSGTDGMSDWDIQSARDNLDDARAGLDKVVERWDDDDPWTEAQGRLGTAMEAALQAASTLETRPARQTTHGGRESEEAEEA